MNHDDRPHDLRPAAPCPDKGIGDHDCAEHEPDIRPASERFLITDEDLTRLYDEQQRRAAASPALPPHARGRAALHDAVVLRVSELAGGGPHVVAVRQALDELDPEQQPTPASVKIVGGFLLGLILALLLPAIAWSVGHWLIPLWQWGFGWAA